MKCGSTGLKVWTIAFWLMAAPIIACGMVYVVGETIEHFSQDESQ